MRNIPTVMIAWLVVSSHTSALSAERGLWIVPGDRPRAVTLSKGRVGMLDLGTGDAAVIAEADHVAYHRDRGEFALVSRVQKWPPVSAISTYALDAKGLRKAFEGLAPMAIGKIYASPYERYPYAVFGVLSYDNENVTRMPTTRLIGFVQDKETKGRDLEAVPAPALSSASMLTLDVVYPAEKSGLGAASIHASPAWAEASKLKANGRPLKAKHQYTVLFRGENIERAMPEAWGTPVLARKGRIVFRRRKLGSDGYFLSGIDKEDPRWLRFIPDEHKVLAINDECTRAVTISRHRPGAPPDEQGADRFSEQEFNKWLSQLDADGDINPVAYEVAVARKGKDAYTAVQLQQEEGRPARFCADIHEGTVAITAGDRLWVVKDSEAHARKIRWIKQNK